MKNKPDCQLKFIAADCYAAVKANPANPNAIHYLQTAHAAQAELDRRARIRLARKDLNGFLFDPLALPRPATTYQRRSVAARNRNPYDRDRQHTARWLLASYRLYGMI